MPIKDTLDKLEQGSYQNSRQITMARVLPFTARDILVKAPLLTRLNMFYLGDRGEGKTQLAHDINAYFGKQNSCYASGRPDFEPSEVFRQLNAQALGKVLRGEATEAEAAQIEKLTANVTKNLFYVDELNRCPPITQNYFFDLMDGKIVFQGNLIPLGNKGYSVGFASANSGNAYHGTFQMDAALLDRMHMAVDITYPDFFPTAGDTFDIFAGTKKDPRASIPTESKEGIADEILAMHEEFKKRPASPILCAMMPYFNVGLDYTQAGRHSKRALKKSWPNGTGLRTDSDENKVYPISKRALLGAMALTSGLEMIAEAQGRVPTGKTNEELSQLEMDLFLDSLRLTVPFSGVISPQYIDSECGGDAYAAFDNLFGENSARRREIGEKMPRVYEAVLLANKGRTDTRLMDEIAKADLTEGEWQPVREAIEHYANSTKKATTQGEVVEQAHKIPGAK